MKSFVSLLLTSTLACAADFATGQAARFIIGQPNFTAQSTGTPSAYQLGAVSGLAYANNTLFVADANRVQASPLQNRILIYNNITGFVLPPIAEIPQGGRCPVCAGDPTTKPADVVLGQADFFGTDLALSQTGLRLPTAVASDGHMVAVADTDNNRVLIWKTIPQSNGAPADIVLGQADFKTVKQPPVVDNKSFRGPQGVWIQGTRFYVADTQNHRVMVWNSIPSGNNQPADFVLGQPNFTTAPQPDLTKSAVDAHPNNMLNPVAVTSDGVRLFVTDLGHNRVLVWNSIPTQTQQPADFALGQPDTSSAISNNTPALCAASSVDSTGKNVYPSMCAATLSFPRFALSDGTRVFIADGGNDRVLVYGTIPTQSGVRADAILGQIDEFSDNSTDSTDTFFPDSNINRSSAHTVRTPMSLAWDGGNLYVSDPFNRRVLVFTPGQNSVPVNGITNAASRAVYALGSVTLTGTITVGDTVTITIQGTDYKYTIVKDDTLTTIIGALVNLINANGGDPNVIATGNPLFNEILLRSKLTADQGNAVTYSVLTAAASTTATPTITATAAGANLAGGQNAAEVAPGSLVTIIGTNLSDVTISADPNSKFLPNNLGGVEVYFDGMKAPLFLVSPTQINTQVPFNVQDASSISSYVVTKHSSGITTATTAVNVPIVFANPGIFAAEGPDPRPAIAYHASSNAIAVVDVGGTINTKAGDVATIMIEDRSYSYSVQTTDTLDIVRDMLIAAINANPDEKVTATAAGQFDRIILTAKVAGPDGSGIAISVTNSTSATITLTALQAQTCCSSTAGTLVNDANPAMPGELISVYATGLGIVQPQPDDLSLAAQAGIAYAGPPNAPTTPVDDAQVGGKTANVLNAGLKPGMVGVYEVQLQLAPDLPTNPQTQLFIAQSVFTSNIVTIPVMNPSDQPTGERRQPSSIKKSLRR